MNPLNYLKIGGGVVAAVALALLLYFANDRFVQKDKADAAEQCASAAADPNKSTDPCLPNLKVVIERDQRAADCEKALLPDLSEATRFAMQQSCSAGIKRLVARMDAGETSAADYLEQLTAAKAGEAAAVARAEARGTRQQERDADAREAISAAPRGADGRITCDAGCLRRLSGS